VPPASVSETLDTANHFDAPLLVMPLFDQRVPTAAWYEHIYDKAHAMLERNGASVRDPLQRQICVAPL
jgi:hypothetical protein